MRTCFSLTLGGLGVALAVAASASGADTAETKVLLSFEDEREVAMVSTNGAKARVDRHATEGGHALEIAFGAVSPEVAVTFDPPVSFSDYGWLKLDTHVSGSPLLFTLRIQDAAGAQYVSWYYLFAEGRQTIEYALQGLAAVLDPARVASLRFTMEGALPASYDATRSDAPAAPRAPGGRSAVLTLDNVRLHRGPHDDGWLLSTEQSAGPAGDSGLVPDGGFELGFQRWGSWGTWDDGEYLFGSGRGADAHGGTASASIVCRKPGRGGIYSSPFTPRRGTYGLSFWVKGSSPGTRMFYALEGEGAAGIAAGGQCDRFSVPGAWTRKAFTVKVAEDAKPLALYLYHVGDGALFLDDVSLLPEGGAAPAPPRAEVARGRPSEVTIKGRATFVAGKPFFPLGFYGRDPRALAGTPFNYLTLSNIEEDAATGELLDECRDLGIMAQVSLTGLLRAHLPESAPAVARRYRNYPALFGWYLCDEPDHGRWNVPPPEIRLAHGLLQAEDPGHPTWIVVMPWAPSIFYQYANTTSILASDVYPELDQKPVDVLAIARATDLMMGAHRGPVWMVPLSSPKASPEEQCAMTYLALVHGATGLIHWNLEDARSDPKFWRFLVALGGEVRALAPALLGDAAPGGVKPSDSRVHAALKRGPDGWYVVTINAAAEPLRGVTLAVTGPRDGGAEVLFEHRTVRLAAGALRDDYAGYERHVYRLRAGSL